MARRRGRRQLPVPGMVLPTQRPEITGPPSVGGALAILSSIVGPTSSTTSTTSSTIASSSSTTLTTSTETTTPLPPTTVAASSTSTTSLERPTTTSQQPSSSSESTTSTTSLVTTTSSLPTTSPETGSSTTPLQATTSSLSTTSSTTTTFRQATSASTSTATSGVPSRTLLSSSSTPTGRTTNSPSTGFITQTSQPNSATSSSVLPTNPTISGTEIGAGSASTTRVPVPAYGYNNKATHGLALVAIILSAVTLVILLAAALLYCQRRRWKRILDTYHLRTAEVSEKLPLKSSRKYLLSWNSEKVSAPPEPANEPLPSLDPDMLDTPSPAIPLAVAKTTLHAPAPQRRTGSRLQERLLSRLVPVSFIRSSRSSDLNRDSAWFENSPDGLYNGSGWRQSGPGPTIRNSAQTTSTTSTDSRHPLSEQFPLEYPPSFANLNQPFAPNTMPRSSVLSSTNSLRNSNVITYYLPIGSATRAAFLGTPSTISTNARSSSNARMSPTPSTGSIQRFSAFHFNFKPRSRTSRSAESTLTV